jgi:hypothetical protein
MRIKVLVQQVDEQDLMFQKPVSRKGARLLQLEHRDKRRLVEELQRLRAEQEEALRAEAGPSSLFASDPTPGLDSVDSLGHAMRDLSARIEALSSSLSTQKYGAADNKQPTSQSIVNDLLQLQSRFPVYSTVLRWQEKLFSPRELMLLAGHDGRGVTGVPQLASYQAEIRGHLQQLGAAPEGAALFAKAKELVASFGNVRVCSKVDADDFHNHEYDEELTTSHDQRRSRLASALQQHQLHDPLLGQPRPRARGPAEVIEGEGAGALVGGQPDRHAELDYEVMYVTVNVSDTYLEADAPLDPEDAPPADAPPAGAADGGTGASGPSLNPHSELEHLRDPRDAAGYGHEHTICRIRAYRNGTFDVLPALSSTELDAADAESGDPLRALGAAHVLDPQQWYYFSARGRVFRYRVELASRPASLMELAHREQELLSVLFQYRQLSRAGKLADAVARRAAEQAVRTVLTTVLRLRLTRERREREEREKATRASDFAADTTTEGPPAGAVQAVFLGDISHLEGFDHAQVYVEYRLVVPPGWRFRTAAGARHAAITHTSRGYYGPQPAHSNVGACRFHHPSQPLPRTRRDHNAWAGSSGVVDGFGEVMSRDDTADLDLDGDGDYRDLHAHQGGFLCCAGERDRQLVHLIGHPLEMDLLCVADRDALFAPTHKPDAAAATAQASKVYDRLFTPQPAASAPAAPARASLPLQSSPLLCLTVFATDWLHRHTPLGHAFAHLPSQPGSHVLRLRAWRPLSSPWEQLRGAFLGGGPRLYDVAMAAYPRVDAALELDMTHAPGGWRAAAGADEVDADGLPALDSEDSESEEEAPAHDNTTEGLRQRFRREETTSSARAASPVASPTAEEREKAPLLSAEDRVLRRVRRQHRRDAIQLAKRDAFDLNNMFGNPLAIFYNRYGLRTENSGTIVLNMNVMFATAAAALDT